MTVTREAIYGALFALGQGLQWTGGSVSPETGLYWASTSRKVKTPDQLVGMMPALCQAEFLETTDQQFGVSAKRVWKAAWFVYHYDGSEDAIPAMTTNAILDAVDALFEPANGPQNLGGLVERVLLQGETEKYGGSIDPQVLLVIPFQIIVP